MGEREENVIGEGYGGGQLSGMFCFLKKFEAKTAKHSDFLKLEGGYPGLQSIIYYTFLNIFLKCLLTG